jgi:cellulose biosynthesis protein BcsQ
MLIAFEQLRKLNELLAELKEHGRLVDYRLILKLNMSVNLYVVTDKLSIHDIDSMLSDITMAVDREILSVEEFQADDYYKSLFESTKNLDFSLRRSLSNVLEIDDDLEKLESCPIVSFYSFKGGVGRTTALALYASHYAMVHSKKIFIIDCDFEAPGLINFYGIRNEESPKNGIIEYLKDKEALAQIDLNDNYIYEVSKKYSGDGAIYILPSGNIFDSLDRQDYIEALARIDVHSSTTMIRQLRDLIVEINKAYRPDVILIDSRTGFTDIFGIIANRLADIVVGFFGNNAQNRPGLHFLLDTVLNKRRNVNLILVLSIISSSFNQVFTSFCDNINKYIQANISGNLDSIPALPMVYLSRYPSLERIGTDDEEPDDFVTMIERRMLSDYQELFDKLSDQISGVGSARNLATCVSLGSEITPNSDISRIGEIYPATEKRPELSSLKATILRNVYDKYPATYAENIDFSDDFLKAQFYFRRCMDDIFNTDKFLLLGGKGTGKTAFYRALSKIDFLNNLLKRAQKNHLKYKVVTVISMPGETESMKKFIDVASRFQLSQVADSEFFFRRFWEVYIWLALRLDDSKTGYISTSGLEARQIRDDNATAEYFLKCISDDSYFTQIEKELYDIDTFFKKSDMQALLLFDQLDKVVKPNLWSRAIAPLIRFAQSNNFVRLQPRLFVRRDLFNKLGNLTNKESLVQQAINLEWAKEELFAFFFKVVFAHSQDDFTNYCDGTDIVSDAKLKDIRQKLARPNSYNQLPPEQYYMKPLVEVFFGRYAGMQGKYGEMYDWIHRNICNADETVSLRPFLDLIRYAIEKQQERPDLNQADCPILSPECFKADVREKAVGGHFKDLADEEGNEALRLIMQDIKDDRVPREFKRVSLMQDDFEKLLKLIIKQHEELTNATLLELEDTLILNGIIFVKYMPGGKKRFTFAYLYKYYLGLRSERKW